jgi:formylglycine-generating enzyme required for sulfatase activity
MSRLIGFALLLLGFPIAAAARPLRCPPDSVAVGPVCIDRYEASVWSIPSRNTKLIGRLQSGKADLTHLLAGATQLGAIPEGGCTYTEYPATFPVTGDWTEPLYAASVAGVPPSTCITWFQAEQACRLAGKRLVRNEEWQGAAAGTPDPGAEDDGTSTCATNSDFAALAGGRSACVSKWGTHDMVGNVWEWIAEWGPPAPACTFWDAQHGGDLSCMGLTPAPATPLSASIAPLGLLPTFPPGVPVVRPLEAVEFQPNLPGAIIRGGNYATGTRNGQFAIFSGVNPSNISRSTGFRCAR